MNLIKAFEQHAGLSTRKNPEGMSKKTYTNLLCYLREFDSYLFATDPRPPTSDLRLPFINWLSEKKLAHSTKSTIAIELGKFLFWQSLITESDYKIIKSAFFYCPPYWSEKELNDADIIAILQAAGYATHQFNARRNVAIVAILMTIGCRISQLLSLASKDVVFNEESKQIEITLKLQKQNNQKLRDNLDRKIIPYNYKLLGFNIYKLLCQYIEIKEELKINSEYFICTKGGENISVRFIQALFTEIGKAVGVKFTPHYFRHYVGTNVAIQHGIESAAILLGHKSIKTTMRYVKPEKYKPTNLLIDKKG